MRWYHKTNEAWMKARRLCLTATEVKALLPITKTGRTRKVTNEDMLAIYAKKLSMFDPDDCVSTGPAARGHVLEPYAIGFFNTESKLPVNLYHWDDAIIAKDSNSNRGLGFSPDAMSIPQPEDGKVYYDVSELDTIEYIGEVKCYSPDRHMICGMANPLELEERWQIAVAMAVAPSIKTAYLIFYNPSMRYQMFIHTYTREDLKEEIAVVEQVEKDWFEFIENDFNLGNINAQIIAGSYSAEKDIVKTIMKKEEFDPIKSVMMHEENSSN